MEEHLPQKLAVILHADVVGYTMLVQQNETLAHERIQGRPRRVARLSVRAATDWKPSQQMNKIPGQ